MFARLSDETDMIRGVVKVVEQKGWRVSSNFYNAMLYSFFRVRSKANRVIHWPFPVTLCRRMGHISVRWS